MAIPRPKILTAITVPTGGWDWTLYLSNGGQYGTKCTANLAAGTYYMAADNQSDCFIFALCTAMQAIISGGAVDYDLMIDIDPTTHKVNIHFDDNAGALDNDIKLAWTEDDSDEIGKVLGFDVSADDTSTTTDNPTFVADYHHAYGWYADEDGLLLDFLVEDETEFMGLQSRAISGKVKTQQLVADRFNNTLSLQYLTRAKTFSQNVGYTTASVTPYERNEPLECWWVSARQGVQFRVYRDAYVDTTRAAVRGTETAADTTTLTDAGRSWDTEPQQYKNRILHMDDFGGANSITQNWHIASHTATVITVSNAHPSGLEIDNDSASYFIFDHSYETYVLNLKDFTKFRPEELPAIDRYNIELPLFRYV
jgi:hypothetical protein